MEQSNSSKVFILFAANFINFATSFFTIPFLARQLSFNDYGTYGQVLLFGTFFTLVFSLGITTISNIILAEHKEKTHIFFYTTLLYLLIIAAAGVLIIAASGIRLNSVFNNDNFYASLRYYFPVLILQGITGFFMNTLLYYNRVKQVAVIVGVTNILKMGALLFCIYYVKTMPSIYITISGFVILQVLFFYMSMPASIINLKFKISIPVIKQLWQLGLPVMITGILGSGIIYIDGVFISNMLSVKDYAVYRNGAIEFPLVGVLVSSIAAIAMPAIIKLKSEEKINEMLALKKRSSIAAAAFIFPLCIYLVIFSKEFVTVFLSQKYIESAAIFSIYNLAIMVRFNNYQDLLLAYKKPSWVLYANLIVFLISVLLNYYCIKNYGLTGAVAAFLFSLYTVAAVQVILTCRLLKIRIIQYQYWISLCKILVISIIVAAIYFLLNKLFQHMLWLCFVTIAYFASVLFILIQFNLLDRSYVKLLLQKIPWRNKLLQNEIEA